jgi:hypothetical protein
MRDELNVVFRVSSHLTPPMLTLGPRDRDANVALDVETGEMLKGFSYSTPSVTQNQCRLCAQCSTTLLSAALPLFSCRKITHAHV